MEDVAFVLKPNDKMKRAMGSYLGEQFKWKEWLIKVVNELNMFEEAGDVYWAASLVDNETRCSQRMYLVCRGFKANVRVVY